MATILADKQARRSAGALSDPRSGRRAPHAPFLRDAERTRAQILAAAEAEFSAKGLAGARVDAIADASGSNKRMIYYYFGNKEDLYLAVLEQAYAELRQSEQELSLDHLEPEAAIRTLVEFKFDYFVRHPVLINLLNGENVHGARYLKRSTKLRDLHQPLVQTISRVLAAGVEKGLFKPGIDPVQLYISIAGLSYFYFSNAATLSAAFGRELLNPAAKRTRREHAVEVILSYLRP